MWKYMFLSVCFVINGGNVWVIANSSVNCPNATDIDPCLCLPNVRNDFYSLRCEMVDDSDILVRALQATSGTGINSVKITSSRLPFFLVDALIHAPIKSLYLRDCTFDDLLNSSPNFTSPLQLLVIRNVTVINGWQWDQLLPFRKLKTLFISDTNIGSNITELLSQSISPTISRISIMDTNVAEVDVGAFSNQKYLSYLRLSRNEIRTVKRNTLPNSLRYLYLDRNRIHSLPNGMFSNMPHLTSIDLSYNNIGTLSESVFRHLWRNNSKIRLQGNLLKCDCRMKWITLVEQPAKLHGQCHHPKHMHRMDLRDLTEDELACPN